MKYFFFSIFINKNKFIDLINSRFFCKYNTVIKVLREMVTGIIICFSFIYNPEIS